MVKLILNVFIEKLLQEQEDRRREIKMKKTFNEIQNIKY